MKTPATLKRVRARDAEHYLNLGRPVIISDAGGDADSRLSRWTFRRLLEEHGDWVVPVTVLAGGALRPQRRRMRFAEFYRRVLPVPSQPLHYLQQLPRIEWPVELSNDAAVPAGLPYRADPDIYLWCGPCGASSPLHFDVRDNLHVALRGYKRFLLFDPDQRPFMHPHPKEEHLSKVDAEHPDHSRYPMFRHAAAARAVLCPGEGLFIPAGWWHQVHLWTASIAVNYWWTS